MCSHLCSSAKLAHHVMVMMVNLTRASVAVQDYDFENTSPYGSLDQVYASAFNTWQIEEVPPFNLALLVCSSRPLICLLAWCLLSLDAMLAWANASCKVIKQEASAALSCCFHCWHVHGSPVQC